MTLDGVIILVQSAAVAVLGWKLFRASIDRLALAEAVEDLSWWLDRAHEREKELREQIDGPEWADLVDRLSEDYPDDRPPGARF